VRRALAALSHPPESPSMAFVEWLPSEDPDNPAWSEFHKRLNELRESLRRDYPHGILLVGPPHLKENIQRSAPDLWSVRSFLLEIAPLERTRVTAPPPYDLPPTWRESPDARDPQFELQEAQAATQHGEGYAAARRYERAATIYAHAGKLREAHHAGHLMLTVAPDLAFRGRAHMVLGAIEEKRRDLDAAAVHYTCALRATDDLIGAAQLGLCRVAILRQDWQQAQALATERLAHCASSDGGKERLEALRWLGLAEFHQDDWGSTETLTQFLLDLRSEPTPIHPLTLQRVRYALSVSLLNRGKFYEAYLAINHPDLPERRDLRVQALTAQCRILKGVSLYKQGATAFGTASMGEGRRKLRLLHDAHHRRGSRYHLIHGVLLIASALTDRDPEGAERHLLTVDTLLTEDPPGDPTPFTAWAVHRVAHLRQRMVRRAERRAPEGDEP